MSGDLKISIKLIDISNYVKIDSLSIFLLSLYSAHNTIKTSLIPIDSIKIAFIAANLKIVWYEYEKNDHFDFYLLFNA